jgi:hypothetical protein
MSVEKAEDTRTDLEKLPNQLRQVGEFVLMDLKNVRKPLTDICKELGLNIGTVYNEINQQKKKGIYFWTVVKNEYDKNAGKDILAVKQAVQEKALDNTCPADTRAAELYLKSVGENIGVNKTDVNVNIQNNYLTMNSMTALPGSLESEEDDDTITTQYVVTDTEEPTNNNSN